MDQGGAAPRLPTTGPAGNGRVRGAGRQWARRAQQERARVVKDAGGYYEPAVEEAEPYTATARRAIGRLARAAKLPPVRFHDLRHSHTSMLFKSGAPVRVVADRLGHATPILTMNSYAHVLAGQDADAAAKLEAALKVATNLGC